MDYPENIILPSPIQRDEEGHALIMRNLTLRSVFQPILSISHRRVIGYEALLRASDAQNHLIPFGPAISTAPAVHCMSSSFVRWDSIRRGCF
jgi:EAL domain-containing protein (putative c-di-GMP-specific phosphodiesterase class I)